MASVKEEAKVNGYHILGGWLCFGGGANMVTLRSASVIDTWYDFKRVEVKEREA